MWLTKRGIGIFYYSLEWKKYIEEKIIEYFGDNIKVRKNDVILLDNDTSITLVKGNDGSQCCGRRFDEVYIQDGLDPLYVGEACAPTICRHNIIPMVVSTFEEIMRGQGIPVEDYLYICKYGYAEWHEKKAYDELKKIIKYGE